MSTKGRAERVELLQGTLDLLILRTLLLGPAHGHYPALHRPLKRAWISVEEGASENNRHAHYYCLTASGRKQLSLEISKWERLAGATTRMLRPATEASKP